MGMFDKLNKVHEAAKESLVDKYLTTGETITNSYPTGVTSMVYLTDKKVMVSNGKGNVKLLPYQRITMIETEAASFTIIVGSKEVDIELGQSALKLGEIVSAIMEHLQ